ncbi:probable serine/threonine-protein kinase PBL28 [Magnolia sinica]|uniref:probable serine/threonine-protein kinase PBL28 n=1 Tax=Magnolia sinica TaxID=86752 RepID=UPI002659B8A9|nr:probable serine/threonine-protein kinase PBL28 [Magnolia sinica]
MGSETLLSGESVIVVMDANRSRGNVSALKWALNNVVRPKDTVVVLGILCECGKKSSCFPFYMGIGISTILERLEFSTQGDMTPRVLEEEIIKKREEYQHALQPFYRQCKRSEVKLEVKLAAGFPPRMITVEEARNANTRWIVLDSPLKKDRVFIFSQVSCNIAVMKGCNVATIMPSLAAECNNRRPMNIDATTSFTQPEKSHPEDLNPLQEENDPGSPLSTPCWLPLSWQPGFPRCFTLADLETITNSFADENVAYKDEKLQVYEGVLLETPVLVKRFAEGNDRFWSEFKVLSAVRHRNILNLVGYCCTASTMYLLHDYPCNGSLDGHLHGIDSMAKKLSWKVRWEIALAIGGCLRYLHEECAEGPFVHLGVRSSNIVLSHNRSALLTGFNSARQIGDSTTSGGSLPVDGHFEDGNLAGDELLSIDVHAYGLLLLELITGQQLTSRESRGVGQALTLLENGSHDQLRDRRLVDSADEVLCMASAALLCLRKCSSPRPSISEVLTVVRGDRFAAGLNGEFI